MRTGKTWLEEEIIRAMQQGIFTAGSNHKKKISPKCPMCGGAIGSLCVQSELYSDKHLVLVEICQGCGKYRNNYPEEGLVSVFRQRMEKLFG